MPNQFQRHATPFGVYVAFKGHESCADLVEEVHGYGEAWLRSFNYAGPDVTVTIADANGAVIGDVYYNIDP